MENTFHNPKDGHKDQIYVKDKNQIKTLLSDIHVNNAKIDLNNMRTVD